MQISEATAIAGVEEERPLCNPPDVKPGTWTSIIDGINGGVGSAQTLLKNMTAAGEALPEYPILKDGLADLFGCSQSVFPVQTHHLIPEKQLPDHLVTAWLTKDPKAACQDPEYKLAGDTAYDTNGAKNGCYMPFASTTYQWNIKVTKRASVCFEMMRRTKMQLHQSRHSVTSDYSEERDLEKEVMPYKKQVDEFLEEVRRVVRTHVANCTMGCKKDGKQKVEPLESTVRMVEQVSFLMRVLISRGSVVVSRRAGHYRNKYNPDGKGYTHPSKPFVTPADFD